MNVDLIRVEEPNYKIANQLIVRNILEQIGVPVSPEALEKGLKAEQPCRLERVPPT